MIEKFHLDRTTAALVVVDIQERLAVAMKYREQVETNTIHLIEAAKLLGIPTIVTEQYPKGLGPTTGVVKAALSKYEPIEKITFSCCGEPEFMKAVAGLHRKHIIVAGMETHVCVLQTVVGLMGAGYHVHLVKDAVCSRMKSNFEVGIGMAHDAGAVITSTETALFALLQRAGSEEFKAISKRIK